MAAVGASRVVKSGDFRGQADAQPFNFEDIKRRCDEHVERVRAQAKQILETAATDAELLKRKATEEGRVAGREEGLRDAARQIEQRAAEVSEARVAERLGTMLPALQKLSDSLHRERQQWLHDWERAAVDLCVAVARKIVGRELEHCPELSRNVMARALQLATGSTRLTLRLHPADLERLGPHGDDVVRSLSACRDVTLAADPAIAPGGCVVTTDAGEIDATIDTQLARIADELLQRDA